MIVHELRLLLGRELHHATGVIRMAHGGEDPAADTEVRMSMMSAFLRVGEAEYELAELVCGHGASSF